MTLLLVTTFPLPLSLGKCLAKKFYNFLVENVGPRGHRGHASPAMQAIMIAVATSAPPPVLCPPPWVPPLTLVMELVPPQPLLLVPP